MTSIRARVLAATLIASFTALMGGPLFAAHPHEVCDGMRHGCAKIDALDSCCCGDNVDRHPSPVPSARADIAPAAHAVLAVWALELPAVTVTLLHEGLPSRARPPDLHILFSDLRI